MLTGAEVWVSIKERTKLLLLKNHTLIDKQKNV